MVDYDFLSAYTKSRPPLIYPIKSDLDAISHFIDLFLNLISLCVLASDFGAADFSASYRLR